jgi:formate dehydrogenase iron-sulfur subunit
MSETPAPVWRGEAERTAGVRVEPGGAYGFFTDTTLCIGCKACEVACKQWNQLPAEELRLSGRSYDNTGGLGATTWRHVHFIEQFDHDRFAALPEVDVPAAGDRGSASGAAPAGRDLPARAEPWGHLVRGEQWSQPGARWIFMSDVCKHCVNAPCLEACPTGSIIRTEFDTVYIQQDVCNGCGYCVGACPFGVVELDRETDGKAHKCTLCYDRLKDGLEPACAKSCPTDSIRFGPMDALLDAAVDRVAELRARGVPAYLYGSGGVLEEGCDTSALGGLNAFFLLIDEPEVYNLPPAPRRPSNATPSALAAGLLTAAALVGLAAVAFAGSSDEP